MENLNRFLKGKTVFIIAHRPSTVKNADQIIVMDEGETDIKQIQSVTFDNMDFPLQPADLYGFRGVGAYQMELGSYKLEWTISTGKRSWPRTKVFKQTVTIHPGDSWTQVTIKGDKATVF